MWARKGLQLEIWGGVTSAHLSCNHWNTPSSSFKAEHFYGGLKKPTLANCEWWAAPRLSVLPAGGKTFHGFLPKLSSGQWDNPVKPTAGAVNSTWRLSPAMANKWSYLFAEAVGGSMGSVRCWMWEKKAPWALWVTLDCHQAPLLQPHQSSCSWRSPVFVALIEGHNQTNLSSQPIKTTEFIW